MYQLLRAAESILLNLAEAARQRGAPARLRIADYAIGSSLECAACLDVARIKELLARHDCYQEKHLLSEITKMLIGLRKGWAQSMAREEPPDYAIEPRKDKVEDEAGQKEGGQGQEMLFHHERLEVYRLALVFMEWFVTLPGGKDLSSRLFRQMDEAGTSVVLNIAEGNGRYAELDQLRFLQMAQSAAVKGAVYLDLAVERALLLKTEAIAGKEMLRRISAMAAGF